MSISSNGRHNPLGLTSVLSGIRRATRLEVAIAVGLLVVGVGAFAGDAILGGGNPKAVALAYLRAEARSDIAAVSALSNVERTGAPAADYYLLDSGSIKPTLTQTAIRAASIQIEDPSITGDLATLTAGYGSQGGQHRIVLTLVRQQPALRMHATWRVRVTPAIIGLKIPAVAGDPLVDGHRLPGAAGKPVAVAVYPGLHTVSSQGTPLIAAAPAEVDAESPGPAAVDVKLKLTPAGVTAAAKAIDAAMKACEGNRETPDGCPQPQLVPGRWNSSKLVGDPAADAGYAITPDGTVTTHFHVAFDSRDDVYKFSRFVAGSFTGQLAVAADGFTLGQLQRDYNATISRPAAATDDTIVAAVRTSLTACAQGRAPKSSACPKLDAYSTASNITWQLPSDPTSNAKVSYGNSDGTFIVSGTGTATVDFDENEYFLTSHHHNGSYQYRYNADVYWDGSKAVVAGDS